MSERLQKILAEAGMASRREAEQMILAGRVTVNGDVVTQLGSKADPHKDTIALDGKPLGSSEKKVYYLFHKPMHVMVTRHDPQGRPTIYDYLKGIPERVNPVGRLDFDSEGLLLLTNDGDLHARLTHPRHEVPKVYQVRITGHLTKEEIARLEGGVSIKDHHTAPCHVRELKKNPNNSWIEITLTEGKNRQVRRMLETVDHYALRLVRVAIGPIMLGSLKKGAWRTVTPQELKKVKGQR